MARTNFKPLSEIKEINVITVMAKGVHSLTKVKPPLRVVCHRNIGNIFLQL
jgi:hypothetical protein